MRSCVSLGAPGQRGGSEALYDGASKHLRFFDAHGFFANADADEVVSLQNIERARDRSSHPVRLLTEPLNPSRFARFFIFRLGVLRLLARAGLYRYCKAAELEPVRMTAEEIAVADDELTTYLLCEGCEPRLNRDGENWLLPKLATIEKKFPFYDIVTAVAPDTSEDGVAANACARNPEIGFRKLTNFAVGVFWKASVHSWKKGKSAPMIQLGKYGEEFRRKGDEEGANGLSRFVATC